MADNQTQQEDRTEQATSKRLDDARRKGQIPRSRELNMAVVLVTACVALYSDRAGIAASARELMTNALRVDRAALADPGYMTTALGEAVFTALRMCTPFFAALCAAAVLGAVARMGERDLDRRTDARERRPQLVRHVGGDAALFRHVGAELPGHGIDR